MIPSASSGSGTWRDGRPILAAVSMPQRWGERCADLAALSATPASVGADDRRWLDPLRLARLGERRAEIEFDAAGSAGHPLGATDELADAIRSIAVRPAPEREEGFAVGVDFSLDRFLRVAEGLRSEAHGLGVFVDALLNAEGPLHLQTAQQFGHTVRMLSLHQALQKHGGHQGLLLIVPTDANAVVCGPSLADGRALLWRPLIEPGYGDPSLALPADPGHLAYCHTVAMCAAANRHVLALAMGALACGSELLWVNDGRHEGPALFRAVVSWLEEGATSCTGKLHACQLSHTALDPTGTVPDEVERDAARLRAELEAASERLAPDRSLVRGPTLQRHQMVAQAQVAERCAGVRRSMSAHTLYMTPFEEGDLRWDQLDAPARAVVQHAGLSIIPEISVHLHGRTGGVSRIAVSLGLSGHAQRDAIVQLTLRAARAKPQLELSLVGQGTGVDGAASWPPNLVGRGVVTPSEHDQLLASADVVVINTARNARGLIATAIARGQGVLLLPPVAPLPAGLDDPFQLAYLNETLDEHLSDLSLALAVLRDCGVDDPHHLIVQLDGDLSSQALHARHLVRRRLAHRMASAEDLAISALGLGELAPRR